MILPNLASYRVYTSAGYDKDHGLRGWILPLFILSGSCFPPSQNTNTFTLAVLRDQTILLVYEVPRLVHVLSVKARLISCFPPLFHSFVFPFVLLFSSYLPLVPTRAKDRSVGRRTRDWPDDRP